MRRCAVNDGFEVPFIGKVINAPNLKRVPPGHGSTISQVSGINAIAEWISKRGWNVIFERGGETGVVPALRNVTINTMMSKSTMLYSILHEAGHVSLFSKPGYLDKYSDGYVRLSQGKSTKSLVHRMDVLAEELAAWDEGEIIAKSLSIDLDQRGYKAERNRSMKTYVEWVAG